MIDLARHRGDAVMKLLSNVIEQLGGRTEFTENREEEARIDGEIRNCLCLEQSD